MNEPVADEVRSILDGHIILSAELARQHHYPAISILDSVSRVMTSIVPKEHVQLVGKLKEVLASYQDNELLIKIGEYKRGSNKLVDYAMDHIDKIKKFLKQAVEEKCNLKESWQLLRTLFK